MAQMYLRAPLGTSWIALGVILGPLGAILGGLGASWGTLRASWGDLGEVWEPLGRLSDPLGAILGVLEPTRMRTKRDTKTRRFQDRKGGGVPYYFGTRFGRPKSTKMAPKTRPNLRRFSRAKKMLFKSVLEPSWADLGAFWTPSWGKKNVFVTESVLFGGNSRF